MSQPQGGAEPSLTLEGAHGSTLRVMHSERVVRYFMIEETELEMVTYANNKAATFMSLGSFFAAAFVGVVLNYSFSGITNDFAGAMVYVGLPSLAALVALLFWLARNERASRSQIIDRIKQDSRPLSRSLPPAPAA